MKQVANVNNRYMWTAEEVKLFLALIEEEKKPYSYFRCKTTQFHYISGPKRGCYQKDTTSPGMCIVFPLQPLDGNAPNSNFFFANFLKICITF